MPKLQDIPALPSDAAELLEAVGYLDDQDLAGANISELHTELVKANEKLSILDGDPTEGQVKKWQESLFQDTAAGEFVEEEAVQSEPEKEDASQTSSVAPDVTNFENDPELLDMLELSPVAELLPASLIKRHKLAVADIPEGVLLTECELDMEVNVLTTSRISDSQRRIADARRTGLMASKVRNFDQAESSEHVVKPLDRGAPRDSVSLSDGLNKGVSPESRRFVRGVLHPDAGRVRVAAFFAALVMISLIVGIIGIPWLLIHEYRSGDSMLWWVIGIALTMLVSALCYVFWGLSARCRVCGQRQFAPKKCIKNKKAHHIPLLGYILPSALHALFYKWLYCTYCGTAVRLKK